MDLFLTMDQPWINSILYPKVSMDNWAKALVQKMHLEFILQTISINKHMHNINKKQS